MRVAFREFQQRVVSLAARPPGWRFHLLLVLPALAVLYAFSFPGIHVVMAVFATYALAAAVVVWILRLVGYLVLRSRGGAIGKERWFTIAPLGAAVVGGLLLVDVPLRSRSQVATRSRNSRRTLSKARVRPKFPRPSIDASASHRDPAAAVEPGPDPDARSPRHAAVHLVPQRYDRSSACGSTERLMPDA